MQDRHNVIHDLGIHLRIPFWGGFGRSNGVARCRRLYLWIGLLRSNVSESVDLVALVLVVVVVVVVLLDVSVVDGESLTVGDFSSAFPIYDVVMV